MKAEDFMRILDDVLSEGARRGLLHNIVEDHLLDGRHITVRGRRLLNFGSCSYLGLEMHPSLRHGVMAALHSYGTQFSSSRGYLSIALYREAESVLRELFGRETIVTPSTTLGHQATMPAVIGSRDVLLLDYQVHSSVQTAAKLVQAQGTLVELVPHNDLATLERRICEYRRRHERIWYASDGLYSMYADFAPIGELNELARRYEQLWLYIDDAHGFSWTGRHGRGHALELLAPEISTRVVVAGSLNKSFAAAGGAVTFADAETRRRVFTIGGPLIFSGPVQPPMLGAVLASARLHLTAEVQDRQQYLLRLIGLFNKLATEHGLPLVSESEAPIRCVAAGTPDAAYRLCADLQERGHFVDTATFPAVPAKRSGARLTITAHHREEDVEAVVQALAEALPAMFTATATSPRSLRRAFGNRLARWQPQPSPGDSSVHPRPGSVLRLEHHTTIATVGVWDRLFAGRGAFDRQALRLLEDVFAPDSPEPEHRWQFHYWLVRNPDRGGAVVAATFFTTALWKSDLFASVEVSREVDLRRQHDPYHLTTTVTSMGSLLTEGDHLFLDHSDDWQQALRLILSAARDEEGRANASAVVVRDVPDADNGLHGLLLAEGFVRAPICDSWVLDVDFSDDREFLDRLPKKARYHQRRNVLGRERTFTVRAYTGGDRGATELSAAQRDHLYRLYRNVHARKLELSVFPLPRRIIDAVLVHPGWELVTLAPHDEPGTVVAFAVHHLGPAHLQPLFVGLDYRYVASLGAYQQVLWQAVRSAQRHRVHRVLLGMTADLQKARFGAARQRRWAYMQVTDGLQLATLDQVQQQLAFAWP